MRALLVVLGLAAALPAAAQPSPRWGAFELSISGYHPNIDAEFGGAKTPFATAFGNKRGIMARADVAYSLISDYGSLDLGIGAGYWELYGKGQLPGGGASSDSTALKVVPTRISLTYRFDLLANQYRWLPLAPYARVSLDRYNWWVTNGSGNTAKDATREGFGATNGYSLSAGVALQLDAIDPTLAREMDRDTGINHTYLFIDFTKSYIKDFGSASSWDLSDTRSVNISGGILFVF